MSERQLARLRSITLPTHFQRNTTGTIVYPLSIVQWTAINACEKPDVTFENTHIENLANEYMCAICMELLTNPISVGTCGHLFCRSCIFPAIRAQNNRLGRRCPSCRDPIVPEGIRVENHAKRVIGNFRIKCPNHQITDRHNALLSSRQQRQRNLDRARRERNRNRNRNSNSNNNNNARSRSRSRSRERNNNSNSNSNSNSNNDSNNDSKSNEENTISVFCGWTGEYRNLTQHLMSCELEIVSCTRCHIPVLRREIASHCNICPWLPVQCNLCTRRYLKCERMVHENVCSMKVIACRYCAQRYIRKDMKKHWDILCPKYPLNCQFKLHGCSEIVAREHMEAHLNGKQLAHLQMISQRLTNINELNGKYNELEEKYDELEEKYDELDDKCEELEQENENLRTDHERLKEKVDALCALIISRRP